MLPLVRKWRSRGHGVHSPFAFSFVTTVLRERCAYYIYEEIDRLAADNTDRHVARRLFRIIIAMRPASVAVNGTLSQACSRAVALALQGFRHAGSGQMLLFGGVDTSSAPIPLLPDQTAVVISRGGALIQLAETLYTPLTRGMLFTGRNMAVIVALDRLPKQKFTVDI